MILLFQPSSVYFGVNVNVSAPVFLFPLTRDSNQSLMVDLGSLAVQNSLKSIESGGESVTLDAYIIQLQSFKISRSVIMCLECDISSRRSIRH